MRIELWLFLLVTGCGGGTFRAVAPEGRPVSVMSYNVLFNSTRNADSLSAIERADPDVLCLTEFTSGFGKAFVRELGRRYPHRAFNPTTGVFGSAIASRWRLSEVTTFPEQPSTALALEATVSTPSGPLTVSCLHLLPPLARRGDGIFASMKETAQVRERQAHALIDRYAGRRAPVLVVVDLNEEPSGSAVTELVSAGFAQACSVANARCGNTFPGAVAPWPHLSAVPNLRYPALWQLDHILGKGVAFSSARVIREGGSDHYPVFATFFVSPR